MADLKARPRPTGAKAVLGRTGFPHVTSVTGGEIDIVTSPSQPGFNPLDLLYSSLSACLVLSARMAASQLGILDRITEYKGVLESYSSRLLPCVQWEATQKGNVKVLNDTGDFYRFFDATPHAEFSTGTS